MQFDQTPQDNNDDQVDSKTVIDQASMAQGLCARASLKHFFEIGIHTICKIQHHLFLLSLGCDIVTDLYSLVNQQALPSCHVFPNLV